MTSVGNSTTDGRPVAFHWSGGKDSAQALGRLLSDGDYDVRYLVTTIHADSHESSVHRIPLSLLRAQADAIGIPLYPVYLSSPGLQDYVAAMNTAAHELREAGITAFAFGDLAHSEVLRIKEDQFHPLGLDVIAPLHAMTPHESMRSFLASGIDAVTVVVNADVLGRDSLGQSVTAAFIASLPEDCDPCGENGEYHTFVTNAPYFRTPFTYTITDTQYVRHPITTTDGVQEFAYWWLHLR